MNSVTSHRDRAFSLVEVVLAIGIVSFSVLATFGLLSVATDTTKRSRDDGFSAQIVQNEFERLRSLNAANFPATYVPRYYDSSLNDLGQTLVPGAVYQLKIDIVAPAAPMPADRIFNAEVHYPANATEANQTIVRFTAAMNLPQ